MEPDFKALAHWAYKHRNLYGFNAILIHDDELEDGEIRYEKHHVKMSRKTRADMERWMEEELL
jgi:hypothetical protein